MYWPPDHDEIRFLAQVDRNDVVWDFSIATDSWATNDDPHDTWPADLEADIRHLFRATWKDSRASAPSTRAYLRLHDSDSSIDLQNGRRIADCDRPDFQEPPRKPFKRSGRTKKRRRPSELIRRGDSVQSVKDVFGVDDDPQKIGSRSHYDWPDRGIRIVLEKSKVIEVICYEPFPDTIQGIWIGANAWEVDQELGRAESEACFASGRIWHYPVGRRSKVVVTFDKKDRVKSIGVV